MDANQDELWLKYAAESRGREIGLLWTRSLYFWGVNTVMITSFGAAKASKHETLALFSTCIGFLVCLVWTLSVRGGKYWHTVWEKKTELAEVQVFSHSLSTAKAAPEVPLVWFWGAKRYSLSKLATAVSDLGVISWAFLIVGQLLDPVWFNRTLHGHGSTTARVSLLVFTVGYAALILLRCRSSIARHEESDRKLITKRVSRFWQSIVEWPTPR